MPLDRVGWSAMVVAFGLCSCAASDRDASDRQPTYVIECESLEACYAEADRVCPAGYLPISRSNPEGPEGSRTVKVRCKR
jgi:hypothetical protein